MAHILVIDDEPAIRSFLRTILAQGGHDVVEAEDGERGLLALKSGAFDLLVTDIMMPKQDGLEVIREVRKLCPGLKIIAISGGQRTFGMSFLTAAAAFGADRLLAKPFRAQVLNDAIRELLGP